MRSPASAPTLAQAGITEQQRVRVMLSIQAHARWPDAEFKSLPFVPLEEAVHLKTDRGPAADSLRRRAVAKLAAYELGRNDFGRAISDLGVNPDDIVTLLSRQRRSIDVPRDRRFIGGLPTWVTVADMTVFGRLWVLVLFLSATGCWTRPPPPIFGPPCHPPSTQQEVFVGLYSIFYRASHVPYRGEHVGWPPVPLEEAARYVGCDGDEDRKLYRVRYAAISLAAGLATLRQRFRNDGQAIREFEQALKVLRIPDTLAQDIAQSGAETPAEKEGEAGKIIDSKPEGDPLAELQRKCCPCLDVCRYGTTKQGVGVVEFSIHVTRDAECLVHIVDPQCWHGVVPTFFNDTHVVEDPPCTSATPPVPTCRSAASCNNPLLAAPSPVSTPPAPGSSWCGLLFEDAIASGSGITANAKNVLGVRTQALPTTTTYSYLMDYNLCEAREWTVTSTAGGTTTTQSGTCAPELDCGYAGVSDTGVAGNANLFGSKHLKFTPTFPNNANDWTPSALKVLVTETAGAACVASATCPGVNLPSNCTSMSSGQSSDKKNCACDKEPDYCDGPTEGFSPTPHSAPLCP